MAKTTIEWTERTLNYWVGCDIVSAGCRNCYAMRMAHRLNGMGVPAYHGTTKPAKAGPVWTGKVNPSSDARWQEPFKIAKPSLFFVNSMSDFWHPNAADEWRSRALDIMRRTPHHEYQVLTKRPELIKPTLERMGETLPPNFWLGATVEDHRVVDRIDYLREIPAEIRFLSVEPMTAHLGPVDLSGIHWVIVGGESGPRARPMQVEWVREVRDQCTAAGIKQFFKQWGSWKNNPLTADFPGSREAEAFLELQDPHGKGGALLDGRYWHEFPRLPKGAGQLL